jgi:hypothetical protein
VLLPAAALETSNNLAKEQGTYETYEGSPMSKGVLQHDMWGVKVSRCMAMWYALVSMAFVLGFSVVPRACCMKDVSLGWPLSDSPLLEQNIIYVSCCCNQQRTIMS